MKISSYFDIRRTITALKALAARNVSSDKFTPLLEKLLLDKFEVKGFPLGEQYIYRARLNEMGRLFAHVCELKHPSSPTVKGRMNDVGEPFFYGALCELGTIYEMVPTPGSLFTISRITKRAGSPIFLIVGLLNDPLSSAPKTTTEKAIYDYLHSELTKVVNATDEYNSTIAIARLLLSKELGNGADHFLSGLAYPSVQLARGVANVRTFNFGMKGQIFDDHFLIRDAIVYCMTDEGDRYQLNEINNAEVGGDGHLKWTYSFSEMRQRMQRGLTANGEILETLKAHVDRT